MKMASAEFLGGSMTVNKLKNRLVNILPCEFIGSIILLDDHSMFEILPFYLIYCDCHPKIPIFTASFYY